MPGPIVELERETGRHFHFEGTEALPIDSFEVVLEGTHEEVEERALPFREGEEVLVSIEEPHMYNDDDAVAKLDGYIVSVSGAARLVGEKTLVRIDKVDRSAAQASLVNPPEGVGDRRRGDADGDGAPAAGAAADAAAGGGAAEAGGVFVVGGVQLSLPSRARSLSRSCSRRPRSASVQSATRSSRRASA